MAAPKIFYNMRHAIVTMSMVMACLWLGYSVARVLDVVPADSVSAGSTYFVAPGFIMFLVSLFAILLPSGLFSRTALIGVVGVLLTTSIVISPWLYAGRDSSNVRPWLHFGTIALIVIGARVSSTWRHSLDRPLAIHSN